MIKKRTEELNIAREKRIADEDKVTQNKKQYIKGLFYYFRIGKQVQYPVPTYDGTARNQLAVFTGFHIDNKRKNPYAPSAIKLKFAVSSSQKFVAIPSSYNTEIQAIKGATIGIGAVELENTLIQWTSTIEENTKDRQVRYIITGNILQAFADFSGKLVSYTTQDNQVKKGILLSEYWTPEEYIKGKIIVPIAKALKVIGSMTNGNSITASHGLSIFKQYDETYRIIVPSSQKKGGIIFLNKDLLKLVQNNLFEKTGNQMVTQLEASKLEPFLEILQDKIGVTVSLTQQQIDHIGLTVTKVRRRVKISPPPKEQKVKANIQLMELEAEALELELELLTY